jgi:hypothetical protein
VHWGGVNLAVVRWEQQGNRRQREIMLGDEWQAREPKDGNGKPKDVDTRLAEFEAAVRANRQLATALREQGLNEDADHFAYHANNLQREVLRQQRAWGRWLWSWVLKALAGYGYKPLFTVAWYVSILAASTAVYFRQSSAFAHRPIGWDTFGEALVAAFTAMHGRGFFPEQVQGGWQMGTAAFDAVAGLLVEVSFVATFVQRFFAR